MVAVEHQGSGASGRCAAMIQRRARVAQALAARPAPGANETPLQTHHIAEIQTTRKDHHDADC
jgi:hypothetical protein